MSIGFDNNSGTIEGTDRDFDSPQKLPETYSFVCEERVTLYNPDDVPQWLAVSEDCTEDIADMR